MKRHQLAAKLQIDRYIHLLKSAESSLGTRPSEGLVPRLSTTQHLPCPGYLKVQSSGLRTVTLLLLLLRYSSMGSVFWNLRSCICTVQHTLRRTTIGGLFMLGAWRLALKRCLLVVLSVYLRFLLLVRVKNWMLLLGFSNVVRNSVGNSAFAYTTTRMYHFRLVSNSRTRGKGTGAGKEKCGAQWKCTAQNYTAKQTGTTKESVQVA